MRSLLFGGPPVIVATHGAPVKEVAWILEMNLLVSISWDKTLRCWNPYSKATDGVDMEDPELTILAKGSRSQL
ncbi:protein RAE1 [Tanacetum coccineum]